MDSPLSPSAKATIVEPEPEKPPTLENTAALFRTLESLERQYQVRVESQTLVNNSLRSQYRKYERLSGLVKSLQANLFSVHGDIVRAQSKRSKQQQQATRDIKGQKGSVLRRIIRIKTEIQGLQRLCTIVDSGGSSGEQKEEGAGGPTKGAGRSQFFNRKSVQEVLDGYVAEESLAVDLQQLKVAIAIRSHRNKIAIKEAIAKQVQQSKILADFDREVFFTKETSEHSIKEKYDALIQAEQQCTESAVAEAKALLIRKVNLMEEKMAQDFDTKFQELKETAEEQEKVMKDYANVSIDATTGILKRVTALEQRIDGEEFWHLRNDEESVDFGLLTGRHQKQKLRKFWNRSKTPARDVMNFLWIATGSAYSDEALDFTRRKCHSLSQAQKGLWQ
jgi:hypothetical protein